MSGTGITPEEAAEWLGQFSPEVITEALVPYMLTGSPRYLVEWPAGLPHDPMWNLIPRHAGVPYECTWHRLQVTGSCPECVREHAEYQETGTWEDRRAPLSEELGLHDRERPGALRLEPGGKPVERAARPGQHVVDDARCPVRVPAVRVGGCDERLDAGVPGSADRRERGGLAARGAQGVRGPRGAPGRTSEDDG